MQRGMERDAYSRVLVIVYKVWAQNSAGSSFGPSTSYTDWLFIFLFDDVSS